MVLVSKTRVNRISRLNHDEESKYSETEAEQMTVTTEKEDGKLTIFAEGKFSTTAAPELEKALKTNIDGVTELIFDFEKVEYLASAGLRVLLSAAKVMKKQGTMKIIRVTEPVMEVFTFTGMADALDIEAL